MIKGPWPELEKSPTPWDVEWPETDFHFLEEEQKEKIKQYIKSSSPSTLRDLIRLLAFVERMVYLSWSIKMQSQHQECSHTATYQSFDYRGVVLETKCSHCQKLLSSINHRKKGNLLNDLY